MRSISAGLWLILVLGCGPRPSQEPQTVAGRDEPPSGQKPGAASCKSEEFGPVILGEADYATRLGAKARRFSELRSTLSTPLEECGLESVLRRLATLSCDDGQNPFQGDLRAAHESRDGNRGNGGRCDNIIDLYVVRCSDKTFEVYADMYMCSEATAQNFR